MKRLFKTFMASACLAFAALSTQAASPVLEDLDQRVRILERAREVEKEDAESRSRNTPVVTAGKEGFSLRSGDGAFRLAFTSYAQFDGRYFLEDQKLPTANTFLVRAARLQFEGTLYRNFSFRLAPEFGQGVVSLQDAYLDYSWLPWLKTRFGKFKAPFGLERLQPTPANEFAELGLPSNLVPNRDVGVEIDLKFWEDRGMLQIGVFNGAPDGGSLDVAVQDDKDIDGRVFIEPFKDLSKPGSGLGLGMAVSGGNKTSAVPVPKYVSASQRQFFTFLPVASPTGRATRLAPQAWIYWGSLGLLSEYVISAPELASRITTINAAQLEGVVALTGEQESYKGMVAPGTFDPGNHTWGSLEIAGRYGFLDASAAFPGYADARVSASRAVAWSVGLNEYLNPALRLSLDYEETNFTGGASQGLLVVDREPEKILFSRVQLAY